MMIPHPSQAIPFFDPSCFGGIIKKPDDGLLSICFIGYLILPEGRRRAYFKTDPVGYAMLNEEIGYVLARCTQLPQPTAGKIWIPGHVMHQLDPSRWPDPAKHALCWVSYEAHDRLGQPAPSIKARINSGASNTEILSKLQHIFLKFKLLGRLIAFDAWIANIDRNIGNILLVDSESFIVIDHGAILGGPYWPISIHDHPDHYVETKVLDVIFPSPEKTLSLPIKSAIIKEAALMQQAWQLAEPWFDGVNLALSQDAAFTKAHKFLQFRATAITEHLRKHTGLVI
jgi:hypothetical protein